MQGSQEKQFFSEQNEIFIYKSLNQEFQQKHGKLTEKQQNRLAKALEHYMHQVWDINGPMPINDLNREVYVATSNDFNGYLRRDASMPSVATSQTIVSDPRNQPQNVTIQARPTFEQGLLQDTGSRFETLQQERIAPKEGRPQVPDFQISLTTSVDEPSALSLYESAKKSRETEASRVTALLTNTQTDVNPLARFMSPPSIQNDPNINPTLAMPLVQTVRAPLQQDYIIKQDDIITYKEQEFNLFLYSADRDWYNNTRETRYTFSVNFDPGNNQQGFTFSPSSNKKFKNISRIELVKAILPTEGINTLVTKATIGTGTKLNILSYPYIVLRIPELDSNNFGTDNNLDNSFGVLQYDANWYSDTTNLTDGYLAMIPKFMKCQKIYHPTPLATLTKLSVELQLPDGSPISTVPDTLSISNIYISGTTVPPPSSIVSTLYKDIEDSNYNGEYLFIVTSTYFSQWTFAQGNTIQIQGIDVTQINGGATQAGNDLVQYLQSNNLPIVGIAYTSGGDGANTVGYANVLIVRSNHVDPSTGSVLVNPFGGSSTTQGDLATSLKLTTFTSGKLINLAHQTNIVLRIITREMDPTTRVRPDNL